MDVDPEYVDEIAVELACRGERVRLTRPELAVAAERLLARRLSLSAAAARLRVSYDAVFMAVNGRGSAVAAEAA
ncbi:hypothetical protein ACFO1B_30925 [Dactylosporangium siamense]|nr:hypothetical protein [Dactylosporangium siamense]